MINVMGKKSKSTQYVIGGVVAMIILFSWMYIPLISNSSRDSSVNSGAFFKAKTADVSALGSDYASEAGASGYYMNAEMLNNPAVSGEEIASSLFQSGDVADSAGAPPEDNPFAVSGSGTPPADYAPSASSNYPSSDFSGARPKLNSVASISGGNSNSMTAGGAHNRFFGTGAAKAQLAPISNQDFKKITASDKRQALVSMLEKAGAKSAMAAKSNNAADAAAGAAAAFTNTTKADTSSLNGDKEQSAASSGLSLGAAADDLKRSDPNISGKKSAPPDPSPTEDKESTDEMMKKKIIEMMISAMIGPLFGAMANSVMGTDQNSGGGSCRDGRKWNATSQKYDAC